MIDSILVYADAKKSTAITFFPTGPEAYRQTETETKRSRFRRASTRSEAQTGAV